MCSWGHTTLIGQCREYYCLSINYALDSEKIASCAYTKWSSMTGVNKQRISPEPKTWIGKCYIPIAQWLEYLACGWGVTGSSPNQAYTIFHFIKLDYFKFTVEIGAVAQARLSFHGLTYKKVHYLFTNERQQRCGQYYNTLLISLLSKKTISRTIYEYEYK